MDKKGQMTVGAIIIVAVTLIVGAIFLQVIAQEVGSSTTTVALVNQSETLAANGASIYIEEWRSLTGVSIINSTSNSTIPATNYTVTNNVINPTTGALSVQITTDDAAYGSVSALISGTAEPLTYIGDSGGRAMAALIVVLFALAVLVVALSPTMQSKLVDLIGR